MERKIVRYLNWYYYGMLAAAVGFGALLYWMLTTGRMNAIDPQSEGGKILQYIVICSVFLVPIGLYGFNRICRKLSKIEDEEEKYKKYQKYAAIRILLVSSSMLLGIEAYYVTGGYMSMLWCAGIGAVAWYFTKPTEKKIYLELEPKDDNQETY